MHGHRVERTETGLERLTGERRVCRLSSIDGISSVRELM
jgi:hypothetical protein